MDQRYAEPDGRKVVYSSLNPADLLRNANIFTYIIVAVVLIAIAVIALGAFGVAKLVVRKKRMRAA